MFSVIYCRILSCKLTKDKKNDRREKWKEFLSPNNNKIYQKPAYLPGSEDTVISKAVPSGRDSSIALRESWSLRFPLMWGTREHNLWELGTAFALSPTNLANCGPTTPLSFPPPPPLPHPSHLLLVGDTFSLPSVNAVGGILFEYCSCLCKYEYTFSALSLCNENFHDISAL